MTDQSYVQLVLGSSQEGEAIAPVGGLAGSSRAIAFPQGTTRNGGGTR